MAGRLDSDGAWGAVLHQPWFDPVDGVDRGGVLGDGSTVVGVGRFCRVVLNWRIGHVVRGAEENEIETTDFFDDGRGTWKGLYVAAAQNALKRRAPPDDKN